MFEQMKTFFITLSFISKPKHVLIKSSKTLFHYSLRIKRYTGKNYFYYTSKKSTFSEDSMFLETQMSKGHEKQFLA